MRLFEAALDTCLDSPFFCQPLSSQFALHGLRPRVKLIRSAPKRGQKNSAARKLSKSVEKLFDTFDAFSPCAKIVEKLFDTF